MTARRPLFTATAAGSVLFALWFVPSANAIVEDSGPAASGTSAVGTQSAGTAASGGGTHDSGLTSPGAPADGSGTGPDGATGHRLADTGSPDTTPYVIGGAACLALGAGLVTFSVRRTRDDLL